MLLHMKKELTVFSSYCGSVIFTLFSLMVFDSIGVAVGVVSVVLGCIGTLGDSICTVAVAVTLIGLVVSEGLEVAVSLRMVCV